MMIHDFKTLLSKVKVGDEVIVHWAHKYEYGSWGAWSVSVYIIDYIQDTIIDLHNLDYPRSLMIITNAEFHDPEFKFELPD